MGLGTLRRRYEQMPPSAETIEQGHSPQDTTPQTTPADSAPSAAARRKKSAQSPAEPSADDANQEASA